MSQVGSNGRSNGPKGRLLLTLCTPNLEKAGEYACSVIRFPDSYEDTIAAARRIFGLHIAVFRANRSRLPAQSVPVLVLKCAITRGDGTTSWCDFQRDEWKDIIRPNEDEIGVFLDGYTNLPYKPGTSTRTVDVANRQIAQKPQKPVESRSKLIQLTYKNQTKTLFAPPSFDGLLNSANSLFGLGYMTTSHFTISSTFNDPTTGRPAEVYMEAGAYPNFIANQQGPITLKLATQFDRKNDFYDYD
ncbi:hypothetical protein BDZ97DRAFT_1838192 [Flammula alnicola]|nr:hypothetical protein BDZ97DRAFT_1838192 [Flammula alnicola]